jgi:hypothetical protein
MPLARWTVSSTILFLVVSGALAQESTPPDPLFQSTEVLDVRIVAPLKTLLYERPRDEELLASLQYTDSAGETIEFDIKIRTRGRLRRQKDICAFPPMRLNFKGSQTKGTLFHKQDKVKLVTHCESNSKYEQVVLREYTAYRILNIMTNASFQVRLLRITYVDSEGKRRDNVRYGFIIEHRDRLAKRLDKPYLDVPSATIQSLDPEHTNLVSMYHFLLGNTDYSPVQGIPDEACCHNHVLFGNEGEPVWSVPYDFDQAGLVNAPHARPNKRFKLRDVQQRLYRGRCAHNDQLAESIASFVEKREEIMAVVRDVDDATNRSEKTMAKYVEKFYDTITSEKGVANELVKKCI